MAINLSRPLSCKSIFKITKFSTKQIVQSPIPVLVHSCLKNMIRTLKKNFNKNLNQNKKYRK